MFPALRIVEDLLKFSTCMLCCGIVLTDADYSAPLQPTTARSDITGAMLPSTEK